MSEQTGFFVSDNKIPLSEKYVAIPSQNGLSYGSQKLIEFYIPPNVDNFNPKKSYLQFDLTLSQDANASKTRLQLDELIGGQILIDTIRIHSGDKTELLEEIRHYPVHVAVKYAYHSSPTLENLRAINEGCGVYVPDTAGTLGTSESLLTNHKYSPYYKPVSADPTSALFTNDDSYIQCKLKLPLHTGIFQNDKVVPCGLLNGLFVTILTSEDKRVFRQLDSVSRERRLRLNPEFHSLNGSTVAPNVWASGSAQSVFYIQVANNNWEVANFPFVVGEKFQFCSSTRTEVAFTGLNTIKTIETSGVGANKLLKITTEGAVTPGAEIGITGFYMYSTSVSKATTYRPTYLMSNCELIINQVDLGAQAQAEIQRDMTEGKMMVYDFLSTQVYNYSQLSGDRVANIGIPANHARAKSVICVPTDASVYTNQSQISGSGTYLISEGSDTALYSTQSGIAGISDRLTEYFFFYDGRNQPSLNVNTEKISSKVSVDAIPLLETDKALDAAEIPAMSLRRFNDNFVVSRSFSLNKGVYDMRNKDCRLNVYYQDSANAPTKNKLWCNFVYHIRRINIRSNSISVEV
tara:strand:- start:2119 stop:3849 length:1731 start_codon:yes stop_codon:yes gene_type:complete